TTKALTELSIAIWHGTDSHGRRDYRTFYLEASGGEPCWAMKPGFAGRKQVQGISSEIFSLPSGFVRHWAPHWDTHGASEAWERDKPNAPAAFVGIHGKELPPARGGARGSNGSRARHA